MELNDRSATTSLPAVQEDGSVLEYTFREAYLGPFRWVLPPLHCTAELKCRIMLQHSLMRALLVKMSESAALSGSVSWSTFETSFRADSLAFDCIRCREVVSIVESEILAMSFSFPKSVEDTMSRDEPLLLCDALKAWIVLATLCANAPFTSSGAKLTTMGERSKSCFPSMSSILNSAEEEVVGAHTEVGSR